MRNEFLRQKLLDSHKSVYGRGYRSYSTTAFKTLQRLSPNNNRLKTGASQLLPVLMSHIFRPCKRQDTQNSGALRG